MQSFLYNYDYVIERNDPVAKCYLIQGFRYLTFREAERNACFYTVIALEVDIEATSAVCKTIKNCLVILYLKLPSCTNDIHLIFFEPLIVVYLYTTRTLIPTSQPLSALRTQTLQSIKCTVVFTKPMSDMKTQANHVCNVLWSNETSVFFLPTRSPKRVIGTTDS